MVAAAPIAIYNHFSCINCSYPAFTNFACMRLLLLIVPFQLFILLYFRSQLVNACDCMKRFEARKAKGHIAFVTRRNQGSSYPIIS
jgi:hypothetical protein